MRINALNNSNDNITSGARSSEKKYFRTFFRYDMDRIENGTFNNSLLPRERLYQVVT
jgi:hypothetical protein